MFQQVFQEVFQEVFQKVFRNVFPEIVREVFQKVFQEVFQDVLQDVFQEIIREVFRKEFRKIGWLKKPLAKVVDLVSLGVLFGPGAPDPDLGRFRIRVGIPDVIEELKMLIFR